MPGFQHQEHCTLDGLLMIFKSSGTLYPRWVVDDILIPLIAFLKKAWTDEKQTHVDLLATQAAGKKAIITSTDYVSLLWTVSENGTINEPAV